jgi:rRNA maturation RNase YbeY
MPAKFYEEQVKSGLKDKRKLSAFLDGLVSKHRREIRRCDLTYIFCSDEFLLEMNQQFLKHDTFTDIITFDMSGSSEELEGEIYISVERVRENAEKFDTTYQDELHRVIFHGALHLCGFKDKKPADQKAMRENEDLCLQQYKKALTKALKK